MLLPEAGLIATPPTNEPLVKDVENMEVAIQQARLGLDEGGIPIGGALVSIYKAKTRVHQTAFYPRFTPDFDRVDLVLRRRRVARSRKKQGGPRGECDQTRRDRLPGKHRSERHRLSSTAGDLNRFPH